MRKANSLLGSLEKGKGIVVNNNLSSRKVSVRELPLPVLFSEAGMTTLFNNNVKAFTLIELLVVVLIIGILAAVALPQYQKAVWKSRGVQLQTLVKSLSMAQQAYFMANGEYAKTFSELDLSFDNLTADETSSLNLLLPSTDAVRSSDWFELAINSSATAGNDFDLSMAQFKTGPYRGAGFVFVHRYPNLNALEGKFLCFEKISVGGHFCVSVMGITNTPTSTGASRYYVWQ